MSSPLYVANNFIKKALQENLPLSPMKLQKLIYFTYRDYLQTTNQTLFTEPICAWKYGPVVESVYHEFKRYGARSIGRFHRDGLGTVYVLDEEKGVFGNVINEVWQKYKHYDGISLSRITHTEGSAWHKAWCNNEQYLSKEDIENDRVR